jgi:hypothetical protein
MLNKMPTLFQNAVTLVAVIVVMSPLPLMMCGIDISQVPELVNNITKMFSF